MLTSNWYLHIENNSVKTQLKALMDWGLSKHLKDFIAARQFICLGWTRSSRFPLSSALSPTPSLLPHQGPRAQPLTLQPSNSRERVLRGRPSIEGKQIQAGVLGLGYEKQKPESHVEFMHLILSKGLLRRCKDFT